MIYSNFRTEFWYTPISERAELSPAKFLLKQLPYKIFSKLNLQQSLSDGIELPSLNSSILDLSIIGTENISNPPDTNWIDYLPVEISHELLQVIFDSSIPDAEFFEKLNITMELAINSKFSDGTWNCDVCQQRKLQLQRNCPYIDPEEYEDSFSVQVLDEIYTVCPMNLSDNTLLRFALESKNLREYNMLPDDGNSGDQSVFFLVVSQKINDRIEYHRNKKLEAASANRV